MTEHRIHSNLPSIQQIDLHVKPEKFSLSQDEVNKLFIPTQYSKFNIIDLEKQELNKFPMGKLFISKLEQWNQLMDEGSETYNLRSQFMTLEFIYAFLKRTSMMKENEIEKQLSILYEWFINSGPRKNSNFPVMPKKTSDNEAYEIVKSFKTNPKVLMREYRPKEFKLPKKDSEDNSVIKKTLNEKFEKKTENNFFTNPSILSPNQKNHEIEVEKAYYKKIQPQFQRSKFFYNRMSSNERIRNEEIRRHREAIELRNSQQKWKAQKSRLMEQISKNYFDGDFNSFTRYAKTSYGTREKSMKTELQTIKEHRVQTSSNKTRFLKSLQKQNVIPELVQISNYGLLRNPNEQKVKKKKKAAKKRS